MHIFILFFIFLITNYAHTAPGGQPTHFGLINQVCAVVESEVPILQSDVIKRAQERSLSNFEAQNQLVGERALWIYAKQQLKFNVPEIYKNAQEHIKKIMENNNLNKESFENILMRPPYSMTFRQYENDTAFHILKNQLESSIASSIEISDKEVLAASKQQVHDKYKEFEVIFISLAYTPKSANNSNNLTNQINKANRIKKEILANINLDSIKRKYKSHKDISFVGPLNYREGDFKEKYDALIKKDPAAKITEPFEDEGMVTMIWKIEKNAVADNQKTALENVRKHLYTEAVQRRLNDLMKNILVKSSVEINCKW